MSGIFYILLLCSFFQVYAIEDIPDRAARIHHYFNFSSSAISQTDEDFKSQIFSDVTTATTYTSAEALVVREWFGEYPMEVIYDLIETNGVPVRDVVSALYWDWDRMKAGSSEGLAAGMYTIYTTDIKRECPDGSWVTTDVCEPEDTASQMLWYILYAGCGIAFVIIVCIVYSQCIAKKKPDPRDAGRHQVAPLGRGAPPTSSSTRLHTTPVVPINIPTRGHHEKGGRAGHGGRPHRGGKSQGHNHKPPRPVRSVHPPSTVHHVSKATSGRHRH